MSRSEVKAVSSGILTDHPNYRIGDSYMYEYGEFSYLFEVKGYGEYDFIRKLKITPRNKNKIDLLRKMCNDD